MTLCSCAVKADQRRAFEFVGSLVKFYGDYRTQKEREAYVVGALYLGATGAVIANPPLHRPLVLVGLLGATVLVMLLVGWQLYNLRFAARMVGACVNVSSKWLENAPGNAAIAAAELVGHEAVRVPFDVAEDFKGQESPTLLRAQFGIPVLLMLWGVSVTAVLWCSVGGAMVMPCWKWLQLIGLAATFVGVAILTWTAGVPWILPNRPRTKWDVWLWRIAFALVLLGTLLQFVGTLLSPS